MLSWLTLKLNTAKSADCIKKCSKKKLSTIRQLYFLKKIRGLVSPSPPGVELKITFPEKYL